MPGGNLCVLDLKSGKVRDLLPQMTNGVFERFDVSFDAKRSSSRGSEPRRRLPHL